LFIIDVEFEKLSLFCKICKIIGHYLSNCRRLQQNVNVIFVGKKTIGTKIQQHHCPMVTTPFFTLDHI